MKITPILWDWASYSSDWPTLLTCVCLVLLLYMYIWYGSFANIFSTCTIAPSHPFFTWWYLSVFFCDVCFFIYVDFCLMKMGLDPHSLSLDFKVLVCYQNSSSVTWQSLPSDRQRVCFLSSSFSFVYVIFFFFCVCLFLLWWFGCVGLIVSDLK